MKHEFVYFYFHCVLVLVLCFVGAFCVLLCFLFVFVLLKKKIIWSKDPLEVSKSKLGPKIHSYNLYPGATASVTVNYYHGVK